jgi:hypothetical protein
MVQMNRDATIAKKEVMNNALWRLLIVALFTVLVSTLGEEVAKQEKTNVLGRLWPPISGDWPIAG